MSTSMQINLNQRVTICFFISKLSQLYLFLKELQDLQLSFYSYFLLILLMKGDQSKESSQEVNLNVRESQLTSCSEDQSKGSQRQNCSTFDDYPGKIAIKVNKADVSQIQLLLKAIKMLQDSHTEMTNQIKEMKEQRLKSQKQNFTQFEEKKQSNQVKEVEKDHNFWIDSNNWHYYLFDRYVNRIKKREGSAFQTIFGKQLAPEQIFTFKIKHINVSCNQIMYGVGSNRIRGKDDGFSKVGDSALYYSFGSGALNPGNIKLNTGGVQNGQVIEITIDTVNWTVTWKKNDIELATSSIPEKIRNQKLYPVIYVKKVGDQIEFV